MNEKNSNNRNKEKIIKKSNKRKLIKENCTKKSIRTLKSRKFDWFNKCGGNTSKFPPHISDACLRSMSLNDESSKARISSFNKVQTKLLIADVPFLNCGKRRS